MSGRKWVNIEPGVLVLEGARHVTAEESRILRLAILASSEIIDEGKHVPVMEKHAIRYRNMIETHLGNAE